jgi:methyl-accepting chemotaxis protein
MLLFILSAAALVFYSTLRIISQNFKKVGNTEIIETNVSQAKKYASLIQAALETDFNKLRSYKQLVESNSSNNYIEQRSLFDKTLISIASNNKNYSAIWDTRELQIINESWEFPYGCETRNVKFDEFNSAFIDIENQYTEGDDTDGFYYTLKQFPTEIIADPKPAKKNRKYLETTILVPLNIDNRFAGCVGADIELQRFQTLIDSINANQKFKALLLANNGDIIAHQNKKVIGRNISEIDTFLTNRYEIIERIQKSNTSDFEAKNQFGDDSCFYALATFTIGNTTTPWGILLTESAEEINQQLTENTKTLENAIVISLIAIAVVVLLFALSILIPIRKTRNILNKLALGDVHNIEKLPVKTDDEMGVMAQSLNTVVDGLNKVTEFAENIGAGNYDYQFNKLSQNDVLGQAVIEMRNSLKKAKQEEELRKVQENQLEWTSHGMNIFNKVLRVDERNLEELSYDIIKTLTTYLEAHMGGIFVKTDIGETEFELISFIGFNKEKYQKKFIHPEDGLVGQCILEKETTFINDVPDNSDIIISGLGKSIPKSVLVVPLLNNRILIGIIEIESLGDIQQYQINFVERIAETIAATVSTVKTNVRTAQLLGRAKKQAEELEQQEEEMRQNMEEMQATQEEASKREAELESIIEGFNLLMPVLEYDTKGKVIDVNDNYLKIYKSKKSQIVGKKHKADLFMNETEQAKHKEFWNNLANGIVAESLGYIKSGKDDYWLQEKFLPIKNQYGLVHKILCVGIDVTEEKKAESRIKQIQEGIIHTKENLDKNDPINPVIDLNQNLKIIDLTYLKMVYKKDPAKIFNILKLYYDTLPSQIAEVQSLSTTKDYNKLKSRINSLKTKMSYLGLKKVYEQLRAIEKILNDQKNLTEIPAMITGIIRYWELAYGELQQLLKIQGY